MKFSLGILLLGATNLVLASSNVCVDSSCLTNVDFAGRSPNYQLGLSIIPSVCSNLAGYYLDQEMRYVCFQAEQGKEAYKFEFFAWADKPQLLLENTCEAAMTTIMANANGGPGPCKGDPTGGGSVENGDWRFTAYANPGSCAATTPITVQGI